jgi:hypothetical protein
MIVARQWRLATGVMALLSGVRRLLTRPPKVPTAAQLAEAARQAQAATRREAADEATRAHSRRVMLTLWPPRPGSLSLLATGPATAPSEPQLGSLPVQTHETRATPPSAAITPYGAGPYWGRFTTCR